MPNRTVFFISDGTGITAETFGNSILNQFAAKPRHVRRPFIDSADKAHQVVREINHTVDIEGKSVFPRASVGICLVGEDLETPEAEELLRNADVAMYMAKRDSKGSYRVFEPTMHERVVERLELRSDLQHALTFDQLELHYQPVVRLAGREILGVEALVRWNHPTRGTIPPMANGPR